MDNAATGRVTRPGVAWWVSLGLAIAWLATLALWWRDRHPAPGSDREREAGAAASRRQAGKRLREACRGSDPETARDALLNWGRAHWPEDPPRSLGALARMVDDDAAREIALLQQALYAPGGGAWQGENLYRTLAAWAAAPPDDSHGETLKPLYQY